MLERIQKANDIKNLKKEELPILAEEIREFLDRDGQQDRWTSRIESWRYRAYNGNAPCIPNAGR